MLYDYNLFGNSAQLSFIDKFSVLYIEYSGAIGSM